MAGEPDHKVSNEDFIDHLEEVIRKRADQLERESAAQTDDVADRSNRPL